MTTPAEGFFGAALVAYFLGSVVFLAHLFLKHPRLRGIGTAISFFGMLLHGINIMLRAAYQGSELFTTSAEGWSVLGWAVVASYLAISVKPRLRSLGAFALPAALVCLLIAAVTGNGTRPILPEVPGWGLALHVPASVLSLGAFAVAFACAVCYLIQDHLLKEKRLGGVFRSLPPLDVLDSASYSLVVAGFCLLSVGMVTGAVLATDSWTNSWFSHPKTLATVMLWLTYAVYLYVRGVARWRGRRIHIVVVVAVATLLASYAAASILIRPPGPSSATHPSAPRSAASRTHQEPNS